MIRALSDVVFVEAEDAQSKGGIILANHKQHVGIVRYVGPGRYLEDHDLKNDKDRSIFQPTQVKPGDRVVFSWRAGMDEIIDGVSYCVMRERDIMAIVGKDVYVGPTENRKPWGVAC